MQPNTYGITPAFGPELEFDGVVGQLPGAVNMSVGLLANVELTASGLNAIQFENTVWDVVLRRVVNPGGIDVITAIITSGAQVLTVPLGACLDKQLFVLVTWAGTAINVYVNGELVFTGVLALAIVPSLLTAPSLDVAGGAVLTAAFYTEQTIATATAVGLNYAALFTSLQPLSFDHLYNAEWSLRPTAPVQNFTDIGSVGGVSLTADPTNVAKGAVRPSTQGQAVVSLLVAPTLV